MDKKSERNLEDAILDDIENGGSEESYMTYEQFMSNPNLGASAYQLKFIKEALEIRYKNLYAKKGTFKYNLVREEDKYIYHIVIPSETVDRLSYDVVIEFTRIPGTEPRDLSKYGVKFYCNSPSFTFSFTYAYNDNDLYIDWLKDKTEEIFLTQAPTQKNPFLVLGYDKFVYMACLFLKDHGLLSINKANNSKYIDKTTLYKVIIDTETKRKEAKIRRENKSKEKKHLEKITKSRTSVSRVSSETFPKTAKKKMPVNNKAVSPDKKDGVRKITKKGGMSTKKKITGKKKLGK